MRGSKENECMEEEGRRQLPAQSPRRAGRVPPIAVVDHPAGLGRRRRRRPARPLCLRQRESSFLCPFGGGAHFNATAAGEKQAERGNWIRGNGLRRRRQPR